MARGVPPLVMGLRSLTFAAALGLAASVPAEAAEIAWTRWSPEVLDRAAAEHKLVLLDVGAVWCHWCHVMDEKTYRDPDVVALVRRGYVAVRVDQDANP